MRPTIIRRLVTSFVAVGALWLISPPRVLAVKDNLEDTLKAKQSGQAPVVSAAQTGDGSMVWSVVQLIFALGIIIAIIYLLIRFLSTRTQLKGNQAVQTLGAHSLASNRSVHVVSIGDKVYLLGVGENVTLLDTLDDPQVIESLRGTPQSDAVRSGADWLQGWMERLRPKAKSQAEEVKLNELNEMSFDAALREKLNSLKEKRHQTADEWQEGQER